MPRNWSNALPEGNGPVPQPELGADQPTLADIYRLCGERLDTQLNRIKSHLDELSEKMIKTRQRSASLEQDAQQSRLATESDVPTDTKIRKHMKDVVKERVIRWNASSIQVDTDAICLTSFGEDSTGPPALPC